MKKKIKQKHRDRLETLFLEGMIEGLSDEGYSLYEMGRRSVFLYRAYRQWASGSEDITG